MMKRLALIVALLAIVGTATATVARAADDAPAKKLDALIIDGKNNHDWKSTTPVIKQALEQCGLFTVEVATVKDPAKFRPDFGAYDVLVSNYNGPSWPEETKKEFVRYMKNGGGLVVIHAADNSFGDWEEYNRMIGLGGWGGRNEKSGPYVYYKNGKIVRDTSPGRGGTHGAQRPYPVVTRMPEHPIMKGLPRKWMHAKEELYSKLRGPAKQMQILATGRSKLTKRHEPILMTIGYGDGRCFHTVLGHNVHAMRCAGFQFTLQRGTEWAATGRVTQDEVPEDFPGPNDVSLREME